MNIKDMTASDRSYVAFILLTIEEGVDVYGWKLSFAKAEAKRHGFIPKSRSKDDFVNACRTMAKKLDPKCCD